MFIFHGKVTTFLLVYIVSILSFFPHFNQISTWNLNLIPSISVVSILCKYTFDFQTHVSHEWVNGFAHALVFPEKRFIFEKTNYEVGKLNPSSDHLRDIRLYKYFAFGMEPITLLNGAQFKFKIKFIPSGPIPSPATNISEFRKPSPNSIESYLPDEGPFFFSLLLGDIWDAIEGGRLNQYKEDQHIICEIQSLFRIPLKNAMSWEHTITLDYVNLDEVIFKVQSEKLVPVLMKCDSQTKSPVEFAIEYEFINPNTLDHLSVTQHSTYISSIINLLLWCIFFIIWLFYIIFTTTCLSIVLRLASFLKIDPYRVMKNFSIGRNYNCWNPFIKFRDGLKISKTQQKNDALPSESNSTNTNHISQTTHNASTSQTLNITHPTTRNVDLSTASSDSNTIGQNSILNFLQEKKSSLSSTRRRLQLNQNFQPVIIQTDAPQVFDSSLPPDPTVSRLGKKLKKPLGLHYVGWVSIFLISLVCILSILKYLAQIYILLEVRKHGNDMNFYSYVNNQFSNSFEFTLMLLIIWFSLGPLSLGHILCSQQIGCLFFLLVVDLVFHISSGFCLNENFCYSIKSVMYAIDIALNFTTLLLIESTISRLGHFSIRCSWKILREHAHSISTRLFIFQWIFICYISFPFVQVFSNFSILKWRSSWFSELMFDIIKLIIVVYLSVAFNSFFTLKQNNKMKNEELIPMIDENSNNT